MIYFGIKFENSIHHWQLHLLPYRIHPSANPHSHSSGYPILRHSLNYKVFCAYEHVEQSIQLFISTSLYLIPNRSKSKIWKNKKKYWSITHEIRLQSNPMFLPLIKLKIGYRWLCRFARDIEIDMKQMACLFRSCFLPSILCLACFVSYLSRLQIIFNCWGFTTSLSPHRCWKWENWREE